MRLIFKHRRPANPSGLTMAWSICYSAAAEMEVSRNANRETKESVLLIIIKYPMETLGSHVIDDQQK